MAGIPEFTNIVNSGSLPDHASYRLDGENGTFLNVTLVITSVNFYNS